MKRHFRELGVDTQTRGLHRRRHRRHVRRRVRQRHAAVRAHPAGRRLRPPARLPRPDPDAATSFAERRRLFDLPRSSWADYDRVADLARAAASTRAPRSRSRSRAQVRDALGLADDVDVADAGRADAARSCAAPVDLLWNGGIGTYVKARDRDRTPTSATRPTTRSGSTAPSCAAKVVGEGGNLGLTQLGRIEYALAGGRINTDAIDNSRRRRHLRPRGQHQDPARPGRARRASSTAEQRNALLAEMTDEVAAPGAARQLRAERAARQRRGSRRRRCSPCTSGSSARWRRAASSTARWSSCRPTTEIDAAACRPGTGLTSPRARGAGRPTPRSR